MKTTIKQRIEELRHTVPDHEGLTSQEIATRLGCNRDRALRTARDAGWIVYTYDDNASTTIGLLVNPKMLKHYARQNH